MDLWPGVGSALWNTCRVLLGVPWLPVKLAVQAVCVLVISNFGELSLLVVHTSVPVSALSQATPSLLPTQRTPQVIVQHKREPHAAGVVTKSFIYARE